MNSIIITPKDKKQAGTVKKILKALDVPFRTADSPYNPEFVEKIMQSEQEIKEGKVTRIGSEKDLAEFLGLKNEPFSAKNFPEKWSGIIKSKSDEELDGIKYEYLKRKHQ